LVYDDCVWGRERFISLSFFKPVLSIHGKSKKKKKKVKIKMLGQLSSVPGSVPGMITAPHIVFFFSQSNKFMDRKAVGRPKPILSMPTAEKQHWGDCRGVFFFVLL